MADDRQIAQAGRQAALVLAGVAVFWIAATWIGGQMGLSNRVRALFDLMALAGFGFALWMAYRVWRMQKDSAGSEDRD